MDKPLTEARAAANYKAVREWIEALLKEAQSIVGRDPGHNWACGRRDVLQAQLDLMDQLDQIP